MDYVIVLALPVLAICSFGGSFLGGYVANRKKETLPDTLPVERKIDKVRRKAADLARVIKPQQQQTEFQETMVEWLYGKDEGGS